MKSYFYTLTSKLKEMSELFENMTALRKKYVAGDVTQIEASQAYKITHDFIYNSNYYYIEKLTPIA